MKIWKIASSKTILQAETWIKQYAKTNGGEKCLIYGLCDEFVVDFEKFLQDTSIQIWALWSLYDEWHDKFPYINETNTVMKNIDPKMTLSDIGNEHHIVIKWKGFWWDGYGKQTLDQIMKNFNAVENPHWFRL